MTNKMENHHGTVTMQPPLSHAHPRCCNLDSRSFQTET